MGTRLEHTQFTQFPSEGGVTRHDSEAITDESFFCLTTKRAQKVEVERKRRTEQVSTWRRKSGGTTVERVATQVSKSLSPELCFAALG